jgi:hypothetical protein
MSRADHPPCAEELRPMSEYEERMVIALERLTAALESIDEKLGTVIQRRVLGGGTGKEYHVVVTEPHGSARA